MVTCNKCNKNPSAGIIGFCEDLNKPGYNLAVFFYGCSFDCLFCHNASHKSLNVASTITEDEMVYF